MECLSLILPKLGSSNSGGRSP